MPDASPEPRLRVLIVDDNHDTALMLSEALSAAGHLTLQAHDVPTALAMAVRFNSQVALLDIGLPVMDGFELARQFVGPGIKLVAVTGYGQEQDRQRSREAGFAARLSSRRSRRAQRTDRPAGCAASV